MLRSVVPAIGQIESRSEQTDARGGERIVLIRKQSLGFVRQLVCLVPPALGLGQAGPLHDQARAPLRRWEVEIAHRSPITQAGGGP